MLDKILQKYLKLTGKDYLIPFLEGLSHLGRPASVLFPYELLEQGLAIILSGLNNTMAVQSNPHWVWPYWVERQINPEAPEFIPTAINLIKTNLTCRNWTSIGLPDSPRESMIDPVGMLTLRPYGWSVFPYLRLDGQNLFPPYMADRSKQTLLEGVYPCVITRYSAAPELDWRCEARALDLAGEELIAYTHFLRNLSARSRRLRFGLAIRPYNPLMIGHINHIRFKNNLWRVNGRPGLLLLKEPVRFVLSDRHHGDPLLHEFMGTGQSSLASRSGIACGTAEYDVELEAGGSWSLESLGFLNHLGPGPANKFKGLSRESLARRKQNQLEEWRAARGLGLNLSLPDKELEKAFYAVKNRIHVFDDGDHFSPGTFLYHCHWFRDSAYIALAFENLGWSGRVTPKLRRYSGYQTSEGFFKSQRGEWDSNGEAIYTLVNHVRRGGDPDLLNEWYPCILSGVRWIASMRETTKKSHSPHFGLLPAGFSAEHFGPNDHYYWDNFWSLAGIRSAMWAAERLGRGRDLDWLEELDQDYRNDLAASMNWAFQRMGDCLLPSSPYRWMDSSAVGNLVAVSPLGLISPQEPWVRKTADFLLEHNLRENLFFQKIVHTGLNPYLSVQLARVLLLLEDKRWWLILRSLLAKATPTYTWPEAMHPRIYGGCMGDGDHGWAASEFLNIVRDMAVLDLGEELWLGAGLPAQWFRAVLKLKVDGATSAHGMVSYTLEQTHLGLRLSWEIRRKPHQDRGRAHFLLPKKLGFYPGSSARSLVHKHIIPLHGDCGTMTFFSNLGEEPLDEAAFSAPEETRIKLERN